MKLRINFSEVIPFLVCLGLAFIAYLYTVYTGSIF